MTMMEVENRKEIRPLLEQVDQSVLTFGPALMMYTALKLIIFFTLNAIVMVFAVPSIWDILQENRRTKIKSEKRLIMSMSSTVNA
jgi:uncharacterized membrane protein YozB (DUF420 family)